MKELTDRGFLPVTSQYALYDAMIGVETRLDLLAQDSGTSTPVLIELKTTITGSEDSYKRATGRLHLLNGDSLPNSYYFRNMIQLLMTSKILHLHYNTTPARAYLMRVGNGKLWTYPIDHTVLQLHTSIYNTFQRVPRGCSVQSVLQAAMQVM